MGMLKMLTVSMGTAQQGRVHDAHETRPRQAQACPGEGMHAHLRTNDINSELKILQFEIHGAVGTVVQS